MWNSSENSLQKCSLRVIEDLLGFASKAGKIAAGDMATRGKLRKGGIFLLILAEDAAQEIVNYYTFKGEELNIPVISSGTKLELGLAIGKSHRAVLGVIDGLFAESIVKRVREKESMD